MKPEKYKWKMREVEFLGAVIKNDRIKIEEKKVKAMLDWSVSKSVKDVQKFLGLTNYYRQFVKDFARITRPLYEMMRKKQKQE